MAMHCDARSLCGEKGMGLDRIEWNSIPFDSTNIIPLAKSILATSFFVLGEKWGDETWVLQ